MCIACISFNGLAPAAGVVSSGFAQRSLRFPRAGNISDWTRWHYLARKRKPSRRGRKASGRPDTNRRDDPFLRQGRPELHNTEIPWAVYNPPASGDKRSEERRVG